MNLSSGEFSLLRAFVERPQRVLTRDQLLEFARGPQSDAFDRAIDVQISRLRRKLEESGEPWNLHPHGAKRGRLHLHAEGFPDHMKWPLALPLFAQTLGLVIATVIAAQTSAVVVILSLPPPSPEVYTVGDVAQAIRLTGARPAKPPEGALATRRKRAPPAAETWGRHRLMFRDALANTLGVSPASVIVDQRGSRIVAFGGNRPPRSRAEAVGPEPLLFGRFEVGVRQSDGEWLVVQPRMRFGFDPWQERLLLVTALAALAGFSARLGILPTAGRRADHRACGRRHERLGRRSRRATARRWGFRRSRGGGRGLQPNAGTLASVRRRPHRNDRRDRPRFAHASDPPEISHRRDPGTSEDSVGSGRRSDGSHGGFDPGFRPRRREAPGSTQARNRIAGGDQLHGRGGGQRGPTHPSIAGPIEWSWTAIPWR